MPTDITTYYLTQGVLGVTVVALIAVVIWQQKRIDKKDNLIADLQSRRIDDANQYTSNYIAIAKETVETSKDHLAALSLLQRSVDNLASALQRLLDK